jgi:protein KTI12
MVSAVLSASQSGGGPTEIPVGVDGLAVTVTLPSRHLTLSELQRIKRQFVTVHKKAITLGTTERGAVDWSEESVANKFAEYMANCIT